MWNLASPKLAVRCHHWGMVFLGLVVFFVLFNSCCPFVDCLLTTSSNDINSVSVPVFLATPCFSKFSKTTYKNVSLTYITDKSAAIQVMKGDQKYRLQTTSYSANALSLDGSGSYGGFPEDLAAATQSLGYDVLLIRGNGDDPQALAMSITFWRDKNKCPIPVFRAGSIHSEKLSRINSSNLVSIEADSISTPTGILAGALQIIQLLITTILVVPPLLYVGFKKLYELYVSRSQWTTGTVVCIVCGMQAIPLLCLSVQNLVHIASSGRAGYSWIVFSVWFGMAGILAIISVYLVADRFNVILAELNGEEQRPLLKNPVRVLGVVLTLTGVILFMLGVYALCDQTPTTGLAWGTLASLYFFCFRLALAIYFIWGRIYFLRLLKYSSNAHHEESIKRLVMVSTLLLMTAVMILASEICLAIMSSSLFFYNYGYVTLDFSLTFTGLSAITEMLSVQSPSSLQRQNRLFMCVRRLLLPAVQATSTSQ
eukprot:TRINITY_DN11574_c0_g1_i1.p1 TRINITY_DN11574_c0_g1~~TRINITY_DN11574_c0_g1_i1.p1  ORF type:complete len:501 (-),score=107.04 TRINITY_DN11574_c0_g1_i1:162-1610(-)